MTMAKALRMILRWGMRLLALLVGVAVFVLAVVMGQPREQAGEDTTKQPLPAPSARIDLDQYGDFSLLQNGFPAPVMFFLPGAGPELTAGSAFDAPYEDGVARVVSLTYALPDGSTVMVQSVYPARALSLLDQSGWQLRRGVPTRVAGVLMARMEGRETIRLHGSAEALYVITLPSMSDDDMKLLLRTLQRTATPEEEPYG